MEKEKLIAALTLAERELPEHSPERVVLLVMRGNLHVNVSNQPLADKAREIARQMLADLR